MDNVDKTSLLKELEFYSHLLKKHQALKKENDRKSTIIHQAKISQQHNKPKSICSYEVVKNQNNPGSYSIQKYSFKKPSQLDTINRYKRNGSYYERQNCNFKYSSSKNEILNNTCTKNLNSNVSIMNTKSIFNSKSKPVSCTSSNGSGKLTYNAKDFIKEVESLTELLKKKASESSHRMLCSKSTVRNVAQNKQFSHKKDQNISFTNIKSMKKETFSKENDFVKMPLKLPTNVNYVNRRNYFINANDTNNALLKKTLNVNKSVYKIDNVKQSLNGSTAASVKIIKIINDSKDLFQKNSKPVSRKVIFSDSKKFSPVLSTPNKASIFQTKPLSQVLIMKSRTSNKVISSTRKVLKKSPHVSKMKSPHCLKVKASNAVKVPKVVKLKQTNTMYRKINKHLTPPNKKIPLGHLKSSLKKSKKKVNNKYKVINKTITPNSNKNKANLLHTSGRKKSSLSTDCDTFLEALNNSAVEKLEQNLLAISSELTAPLLSEKNKDKANQPLLTKVNSKIDNKRTLFKKSKSRISKYKIINSNVSSRYCIKNKQSVHMVPFRKERAVLVRRLFKSKNVIINKNVSPINYSAKMIKSKYLSLNKRKASNWQMYMYPTVSQNPKFKGLHLGTRLHPKQKKFKINDVSLYSSRLIRKRSYRYETHKQIYKKNRLMKNKINRYIHSPVVFIRGTRYAKNLSGKTLRKLPIKGHTAKDFQRANKKLIMRAPENFIKSSPATTNLASRALHRSINRILMASSKKKLSKVNTYCMFYNRFGRCNRGVKCTYIHDPSKIAVCTRFLRGTCKIDGCSFSHEVDPGKMAICSFFLVGQCDKENCHYRHEKLSPNAVLCKDFVQGYCHYGKKCKKAHILICPKYMQGECDKGSSCDFPHPPQKAKKNIQKEMEDEETKPAEVLLEKVLRYFQQGGDSENVLVGNSVTNLFVPKQKKLEEQPSFIPLL